MPASVAPFRSVAFLLTDSSPSLASIAAYAAHKLVSNSAHFRSFLDLQLINVLLMKPLELILLLRIGAGTTLSIQL